MAEPEPLMVDFKRRLDHRFNNDRFVKRGRRAIFRLETRIDKLKDQIAKERALIRLRYKALAGEVSNTIRLRLSHFKPSANQIYPRKVFRHTPPP